jgi:hypothetical protein
MEHRGIIYAIRARPGRDEWTLTIYPNDGPARASQFTGTREEATATVRRRIDSLLTVQETRKAKGSQ